MRILKVCGLIVSNFLINFYGFSLPVQAGKLSSGKTFFDRSPLLLDTSTTYSEIRVWAAKYYFTIYVPENSGEPLKQVAFQQKPSPEMFEFYLDQTIAFVGTREDRGKALNIQQSQWNQETNTITVTFDPPVSPGTTFTIGLKPVQNPSVSGTYLLGVFVSPEGAIAQPMYLGVGRLHFYQNYW